jgi:FkbM family methyltransferase
MLSGLKNRGVLLKEFSRLLYRYPSVAAGEKLNPLDAFFAYRLLLNRNPEIEHELRVLLKSEDTLRAFINEMIDSDEFSGKTGFLPSGRKWMAETEGFRLWFDTGDREMGVRMALGSYEPQSVKLIRQYLRPGSQCIDAGANIGFFTCLMASIIGPHGKVYAFEPMPESFTLIEKNLQENGFESLVTLFNVACSDEKKTLTGSIASRMYIAGEVPDCPSVQMQCDRVDALVDEKIDFVKIDVEGHEPAAIKGMIGIFEKSKPVILSEISEYWLSTYSGMDGNGYLNMLVDLGYDVFRVDDQSKPIVRGSLRLEKLENLEVIALPKS